MAAGELHPRKPLCHKGVPMLSLTGLEFRSTAFEWLTVAWSITFRRALFYGVSCCVPSVAAVMRDGLFKTIEWQMSQITLTTDEGFERVSLLRSVFGKRASVASVQSAFGTSCLALTSDSPPNQNGLSKAAKCEHSGRVASL
eukprot:5558235-Amphidinium_carterae.1